MVVGQHLVEGVSRLMTFSSTTQRDVFSGVMYISIDENSGGEFIIQSPIDTLVNLLPQSGIESKSELEYNKSSKKYKPRVLMNKKECLYLFRMVKMVV